MIGRHIQNIILLLLTLSTAFVKTNAQTQKGKASYYSKSMTGALTSSGERLHHDSLTCAHLRYPFGTKLKVTNMRNGKSVIVRVTDRGPYIKGRIIDLSWGAAKQLDMLSQGVVMVSVEKVDNTVVPFKPSDDDDFPELDYSNADYMYDFKPAWIELEEANGMTEDFLMGNLFEDDYDEEEENDEEGTDEEDDDKETDRNEEDDEYTLLEELNTKPNTSRAYSKREEGTGMQH